MNKKTPIPKPDKMNRQWWLVDAKDKTLGRLAVRIAQVLQGKHKPIYTPFLLCGDYVVVINSGSLRVTGDKSIKKIYDKYSGYPSGRKEMSLREFMSKNSSKVLYLAVKGMLPKNKLAKQMLNALRVYPSQEHPHLPQNPKKLEL